MKLPVSHVMFGHLIACISMAPIGQIFMKFDIEDFYENLSGNSKFGYSLIKMCERFRWRPEHLYIFDSSTEYFVGQQYKGNILLYFHGNNNNLNTTQCRNLTFMGLCIVIIFYYINPNKMHMLQSLCYLTTALHVSGVTITHLQEHKQL
jgi:hypothetical protein